MSKSLTEEGKKALVAGGSGFIGSKKVYFEVLNCIRSGEAKHILG